LIGEKILAAREAANMTQEELGKAVGVSRDTIRRWEKEKTAPKVDQLMAIAHVTENESLLSLCKDLYEKAESVKRDTTEKLSIPVISMRTPACAGDGNGIEVISLEADEWEDVDRSLFRTMDEFRKPFAVYVEGDSMEEMDIFEGERAVINPAEPPEDGECALISYKSRWSIKGVQIPVSTDVITV